MKKIINGVVYDTSKARQVGYIQHGEGINYISEFLYVTPKSGKYFLSGKGGINTKYGGKERIFPITKEHAQGWLE